MNKANTLSPDSIFKEYDKGVTFKNSIKLYSNVKKNENFFIGNQWEGLNAPNLEKPVLNIFKRLISWAIAMIASDNVGVSLNSFDGSEKAKLYCDIVKKEINRVIEDNKISNFSRDALRDAAVDGDTVTHSYYSTDSRVVKIELIDNIMYFPGNPYSSNVQDQPSLILACSVPTDEAQRRAENNGLPSEAIKADEKETESVKPKSTDYPCTTILIRYWKENGTVWCCQATRDAWIKKPFDTGYSLYPVATMSWEKRKNNAFGQAMLTGLIPNQIAINKLFAMFIYFQQTAAFPKLLYDRMKIKQWSNNLNEAIAVNGNPNEAVAAAFKAPDASSQIVESIKMLIDYTRDMMGASDAALGNIKPDNTSAIIAAQKATATPLELQRLSFYQYVEDVVRNVIDIMRIDYGVRTCYYTDEEGAQITANVDFSELNLNQIDLKVDVGATTYWSEISTQTTLDNLFARGLIPDAVTYLESIPDTFLSNKNVLIEKLKRYQQQAAAPETGLPAGETGLGAVDYIQQLQGQVAGGQI